MSSKKINFFCPVLGYRTCKGDVALVHATIPPSKFKCDSFQKKFSFVVAMCNAIILEDLRFFSQCHV